MWAQDLMRGLAAAGSKGPDAETDEITPHPGYALRVPGDQSLFLL